jgi:hypothetical protein
MHIGDPGKGAQIQTVKGVDVSYQADDRADHALADEGVASDTPHLLDDVRDLRARCSGAHHDDHGSPRLLVSVAARGERDKRKAPRPCGLGAVRSTRTYAASRAGTPGRRSK